jgi:hypothetical protein
MLRPDPIPRQQNPRRKTDLSLPEIRTSERKLFRRCPWAWWQAYRMGLRAISEERDALWLGTGVHEALALWYLKGKRRGPHPAETFERWAGKGIGEIRANYSSHDREWYEEPKYVDAIELGIAMLEGYVEKYGKDPQWNVLHIEHRFRTTIRNGSTPLAIFVGTFDGAVRDLDDGLVYLLEHKTATQINTGFLALDDQAGGYLAVATAVLRANGTLGDKERIAGIIYNYLRKSYPDERPQNERGEYLNQDGSVSKRQPPAKFLREVIERGPNEHLTQMQRLVDEVEIMNGMRTGDIPLIKNTSWECTWCPFFVMCKVHERGGDWQEIARSSYIQQDPYGPYHKSAAE